MSFALFFGHCDGYLEWFRRGSDAVAAELDAVELRHRSLGFRSCREADEAGGRRSARGRLGGDEFGG